MKNSIINLILFVSLTGCSIIKIESENYIVYKNLNKEAILTINIPPGFQSEYIGSSKATTYIFSYPDSSKIYIDGENFSGLNYDNLRTANKYYEAFWAYHENQNVDHFGVDADKRQWRNMIINGYSIGYLNVPFNKVEQFDKYLSTVKFKR